MNRFSTQQNGMTNFTFAVYRVLEKSSSYADLLSDYKFKFICNIMFFDNIYICLHCHFWSVKKNMLSTIWTGLVFEMVKYWCGLTWGFAVITNIDMSIYCRFGKVLCFGCMCHWTVNPEKIGLVINSIITVQFCELRYKCIRVWDWTITFFSCEKRLQYFI